MKRDTVQVQTAWAAGAGRKDQGDLAWDAAAAATANPNLELFKADLARDERAASPEGRCGKALTRWLNKSTWSGSGSYCNNSALPWIWYVKNLLPRFYNATQTWYASKSAIGVTCYLRGLRFRMLGEPGWRKRVRRGGKIVRLRRRITTHQESADLWNRSGRLLKGRVTSKKKYLLQENDYGLVDYCSRAAAAVDTILRLLLAFHDPKNDGDQCKPTVVWAASIVLGHVKRGGDDDDKICFTALRLNTILHSAAPAQKPHVFSHVLNTFGSSGPITCHPFARQYDIVFASFSLHTPHPTADPNLELLQSKFTVTEPTDSTVNTPATCRDSRLLPSNIQEGDLIRMEVVSSSPNHAVLQIPEYIGFLGAHHPVKPVIIMSVSIFGFINKHTNKFRARPHSSEFILTLSRQYCLAAVSDRLGACCQSRLFGLHQLLFTSEEGDLHQHITKHGLNGHNSFILSTSQPHDESFCETVPTSLVVKPYLRNNIRDDSLEIYSDICTFIMSIYDKPSIGIHINEINTNLN